MNQTADAVRDASGRISSELIARARIEAAAGGRRILELLEEKIGLPRIQTVAALARGFGFRAIAPATLGGLTPAFDAFALHVSTRMAIGSSTN